MTVLTPDLCVIGAGDSGLAVALGAAALGVPVVVIERRAMDRIAATAEEASGVLLAAARQARASRLARDMGVVASGPKIDLPVLKARAHELAAMAAPARAPERLVALGIRVVAGEARFTDPRTVAVGGVTVRARRFVIATGATRALPAIEGVGPACGMAFHDILDLPAVPKKVVVLGGGPRGVECAQALRDLGAEVALVADGAILEGEDAELVDGLRAALLRDGIDLHEHAVLTMAEATPKGVRVQIRNRDGEKTLTAARLVIAEPRPADVAALDLAAARVALSDGFIEVDARLRTTSRRIHAVGAAVGRLHWDAAADAGLILRNVVFRQPARRNDAAVAMRVATQPGFARIGLSEEDARAAGGKVHVYRAPCHANLRARLEGLTDGHLRIVTDKRDRILGVSLLGPDAGEVIMAWSSLVRRRAPVSELMDMAASYPAFADLGRQAVSGSRLARLTKPGVQRIIRALRHFG